MRRSRLWRVKYYNGQVCHGDQHHQTEVCYTGGAKSRTIPPLESVRKVYVFKQSFLDIRRIEARIRKARAVLVRFSKSLARRRHLPSHAKVLSTTHLLGMTSKLIAASDRLTISVFRWGNIFRCAWLKIGPWYPPSAKSFFRNGKLPNKVARTRAPPSRSWILAG